MKNMQAQMIAAHGGRGTEATSLMGEETNTEKSQGHKDLIYINSAHILLTLKCFQDQGCIFYKNE